MSSRKPCRVEGCSLPKEAPKHGCAWHNLEREPIDRQVSASKLRLAMVPEAIRLSRVDSSLWPDGWRWCAGCQSMVPAFYTSGSRCYACASAASHGAMIEKTYQLTADQYAALLELQDNRCAICRGRPRTVRLAVDHNHRTGKVRGLLCSRCNGELLAAAHDSVDMLKRALTYMETPPASGGWSPPNGEIKVPVSGPTQHVLNGIPSELTAEDGYRLSGSRGQEVIYILKSAVSPPF